MKKHNLYRDIGSQDDQRIYQKEKNFNIISISEIKETPPHVNCFILEDASEPEK